MRRMSTNGFTIVELLVVITVLGILMGLVLFVLGDIYDSNTTSLGTTVQEGDTQGALRAIEKDVVTSGGYLVANTITDPTAASSWSYNGSGVTKRNLIISTYATTVTAAADTGGSRSLLYTASSGCTNPVMNNLVFFVSGTNLYRRTITAITSPCSGTVAQKQTCAAGASNPACQGTDALLLTGVDSFSVDYYTGAMATTPYANQYGSGAQSTIEDAATKTIVVKVGTKQTIAGKPSVISDSLRIVRRN